MKRSAERILTTHVGSLPRPADLLEMNDAKSQRPGGRSGGLECAGQERDRGSRAASARGRRGYRQRRRAIEVELVELRQRAAGRIRRERFPGPRILGERAGQEEPFKNSTTSTTHPTFQNRQRFALDRRGLQRAGHLHGTERRADGRGELASGAAPPQKRRRRSSRRSRRDRSSPDGSISIIPATKLSFSPSPTR